MFQERSPGGTDDTEVAALRRELEELRRQHGFLKDIVDNCPAAIYVRDRDLRYILVNRYCEERFRVSGDELRGKSAFDVFPREVAERVDADDAQVISTGAPLEMEEVVPNAMGERIYITLKFPIRDADGSIRAVCGIATDVTERRRAEQERAELQQRMIEVQQALVRELSTPLIPLAQGVLVMPIIGTVDSLRAQDIMQTLMEGITAQRARIAILDITGVRAADGQVANALIQAARAARLLGAEVVLTGIGPEVARSLVEEGVNLGDIATLSTLQSGIAYALRR